MHPIRAICLPSSDVAFAQVVDRCLAAGAGKPGELEDALRPLFPAASVRARELSGETGTTWYVYRDGRYTPSPGTPWWDVPEVPRVVLAVPEGTIREANDAIAAELGTSVEAMLGEPYLDFVTDDARAGAAVLFETCRRLGTIETVVRVRRPDGETVVYEVHASLTEPGIEILYRRVRVAGERRVSG